MKISPNYYQNTSFKGTLLLKGNCTKKIRDAFYGNTVLNQLAEGKYDIIGRIKSRIVSSQREAILEGRDVGDKVYKFSLSAQPARKGFLSKLLDLLFSSGQKEMKAYQQACSEESIIGYIKRLKDKVYIAKCLGI